MLLKIVHLRDGVIDLVQQLRIEFVRRSLFDFVKHFVPGLLEAIIQALGFVEHLLITGAGRRRSLRGAAAAACVRLRQVHRRDLGTRLLGSQRLCSDAFEHLVAVGHAGQLDQQQHV